MSFDSAVDKNRTMRRRHMDRDEIRFCKAHWMEGKGTLEISELMASNRSIMRRYVPGHKFPEHVIYNNLGRIKFVSMDRGR